MYVLGNPNPSSRYKTIEIPPFSPDYIISEKEIFDALIRAKMNK